MFGLDYMRSHFTRGQRYILVSVLSLFLPFYMCAGVIIFLTIRLAFQKELIKTYKSIPYSCCFPIFSVLTTIVSLYYKNYYGVAIGICFIPFLTFVLYCRKHMSARLFELITEVILVLSLIAALYGLIEYISILNKIDIANFELIIFDKPKQRINSFYYNANYYAMMIEFFVAISFYKILNLKNIKLEYKRFFNYIIVILVNLFMLVLTACRTAWMAIPVCILMMLIISKHYKTCACIGLCCLFIGGYFIVNPSAFPRFDNVVSYFLRRRWIWQTAIACIKDHPFFGEGSLTFMHIYTQYGGHATQHAHNVYLDPLLCYGVVGLGVLLPYVISHMKGVFKKIASKTNLPLQALIIGMLMLVMVHGTMDYTIFFVQTGFLFLLVTNSFALDEVEDQPIVLSRSRNIVVNTSTVNNIYIGINALTERGFSYFEKIAENPDEVIGCAGKEYDGLKVEISHANNLFIYKDEKDIHKINFFEILK